MFLGMKKIVPIMGTTLPSINTTKAFTEIESYIRFHFLDEENNWKAQIAEEYAKLFKLSTVHSITNPRYYNTHRARLITLDVENIPDGITLSLGEIDSETFLGLLYTIKKQVMMGLHHY